MENESKTMNNGLSVEILGQISLMQSIVTLLPDQKSILNFVCQGFKDISGVKRVTYQLIDNTEPQYSSKHESDIIRIFSLKHKAVTYANLIFELNKSEIFDPYVPFIKNFSNMLAVIFTEHAHRKLNETLMEELEQKIADRTRELQIEVEERKQAERLLAEREENLSITLNSIGDAVITTDTEGFVTRMNPVAEKLTGWLFRDVNGKKLSEIFNIVNTYTLKPVINPVNLVIETGEIVGLANHTKLIAKDGSEHHIADSAAPIRDANGKIRGVVLVFRDVSNEYQSAEELRISEEKYRSLVETAQELIWKCDSNFCFTYLNPAWEKTHGYRLEEMIGKSLGEFQSPDLFERDIKEFSIQMSNGYVKEYETTHFAKDGSKVKLLFNTIPLCDHNGNIIGMQGTAIDITVRKRMEEELQKVQKLESLGILAGGIAHDFNNLMGGIFGYIDLARNKSKDEQITQYLSKAMKTMNRARSLTSQLLTFAKGGAPVKKITRLTPIIEDTVKFALSGSNVSCCFDIPESLWQCNIDENQINQVIENIIINGKQAMPDGGAIEVTAVNISFGEKEHPTLEKGSYVKVSIKDSGSGIPKEIYGRIFDPFFTTKKTGHGLGLATSYSIIKRHGGIIDVASEENKGTMFYIYLPASSESFGSNKLSLFEHKSRKTIIIMDDDDVMIDILSNQLETLGYNVVSKNNAKEIINLFNKGINDQSIISAIILDVSIFDGLEEKITSEEIRKLNMKIPIYITSTYANDPRMINPYEYGFTESICKPFTISDLSAMINTQSL